MRLSPFLLCFAVFLGGCPALPGSDFYRPAGKIESQFYATSDLSVFPDDVRANLEKYKTTTVAWTGVITDIQLDEPADRPDFSWWKISVKHRYFDWIHDRNVYHIDFYLSSKGEGEFYVMVGTKRYSAAEREKEMAGIMKSFAKGNMIWAYGHPDRVENGVIRLNGGFANSIGSAYYDSEKMHYGRIIPSR